MKKDKSKRTLLQITGSSFIIIAGLIVAITTGDSITGKVIGESGSINVLDITVVFWGLLTIVAGIWMLSRKDFHESIFD